MIALLKSYCQSGWKEIWNACYSLSPLEAQKKDIGAASQTLLTEVKLRLRHRLVNQDT